MIHPKPKRSSPAFAWCLVQTAMPILARKLGIPQTTLSNWHNRSNVPYDLCASIAASGQSTMDCMLFGKRSDVLCELKEIDFEIMDLCLNFLDKMAAAGFETAYFPVWQAAPYSYNAWVNWLRKTASDGEARDQSLHRLKGMIENFTGLPDGLHEFLKSETATKIVERVIPNGFDPTQIRSKRPQAWASVGEPTSGVYSLFNDLARCHQRQAWAKPYAWSKSSVQPDLYISMT